MVNKPSENAHIRTSIIRYFKPRNRIQMRFKLIYEIRSETKKKVTVSHISGLTFYIREFRIILYENDNGRPAWFHV